MSEQQAAVPVVEQRPETTERLRELLERIDVAWRLFHAEAPNGPASRAVVGDRVGEPHLISMPVTEFPLEAEPASAFPARGELAEQHGHSSSTQPRQGPVRVGRMVLVEETLELGQQPVSAREVRRSNPVSWAERVRELFGSGNSAFSR